MTAATIAPAEIRDRGKRGPKSRYPWKKWFTATEPFTLTYGIHFASTPKVFSHAMRNKANQYGLRLRIRIKGNELKILRIEKMKKTK